MKILHISQFCPLAPFAASPYRAVGLLNFLLSQGYQIDIIYEGFQKQLEQSFIPTNNFGLIESCEPNFNVLRRIKAVIGPLPYHNVKHCFMEMKKKLKRIINSGEYDAILISTSKQYPMIEDCHRGIPVVIDQYAAEPYYWTNIVYNDPRKYATWFFRWNRNKVIKYERKAYKKISGVICITEEDERVTKRYYPGTPTIVANTGFDPNYFKPNRSGNSDVKMLLFSGTGMVRNVEAMRLFVNEIMPKIRALNTDFKLLWIGNVDRKKYSFLQRDWIDTTGFVKHMPPYYDKGMIFVAPFTMGEGMKNKIVEAMACGKVIVSTATGVHGLFTNQMPFVRITDSLDEFAEAVIAFSQAPNIKELGQEARDYAIKKYSWSHTLREVPGFLKEINCLGGKK